MAGQDLENKKERETRQSNGSNRSFRFRDFRINTKILLSFFLGLGLVFSVFFVANLRTQNKNIEEMVMMEIDHARNAFRNLEKRDTKLLSSALEVVIQDQTFRDIYLEKDRGKLYTYGQPLFQKLKDKYGITHWYFILPDGNCLVRLHNKEVFGDQITRATFKKAKVTKELASGIELGKTAFALRVVSPYYNDDQLIGYVELGEEIDHFLEILKGETGNEFAIVVDKKDLNREEWKSVKQVAGVRDNWDDLKNYVVVSSTMDAESIAKWTSQKNIKQARKDKSVFVQSQIEGKTFWPGGFPLVDARGQKVGAVLAFVDVSKHVARAKTTYYTTTAFLVILFVITLLFGIFIARSITKPIRRLTETALHIAKGDLSKRAGVESKDEIGQLATAFNQMADKLENYYKSLEAKVYKGFEKQVEKRTNELSIALKEIKEAKAEAEQKAAELERVNRLMVGRELVMMELKKEIAKLKAESNRKTDSRQRIKK